MPTDQAIEIPTQVLSYLELHHIITIGTSSFTGMPHAATTSYVSNRHGLYFAMREEELTLRNIAANHWASFTIDDYSTDFRKVRELRGVGRSGPVHDPAEQAAALERFRQKFPGVPPGTIADLQVITPLVLDFVDFEYAGAVALPVESTIVYRAAAEMSAMSANINTELERMTLEPGQVIVRQGERSGRFFIVVEGDVEVRREGHGQDVIVTRHGPGQLFGEVGALTGAPQQATVVAVTPAVVLSIDRSSFQDFVSQSAGADLGQRVQSALDAQPGRQGDGAAQTGPDRSSKPSQPPGGWYPDPSDPTRQRYWDGQQWTGHIR